MSDLVKVLTIGCLLLGPQLEAHVGQIQWRCPSRPSFSRSWSKTSLQSLEHCIEVGPAARNYTRRSVKISAFGIFDFDVHFIKFDSLFRVKQFNIFVRYAVIKYIYLIRKYSDFKCIQHNVDLCVLLLRVTISYSVFSPVQIHSLIQNDISQFPRRKWRPQYWWVNFGDLCRRICCQVPR